MNELKTSKPEYQLVACTEGDGVDMHPVFYFGMWLGHQVLLDEISSDPGTSGEHALARSVECVRFAEFAAGAGQQIDAVRAYHVALVCCLDVSYCGHGAVCVPDFFPDPFLRRRFSDLLDRAVEFCRHDQRLERLVFDDPSIRRGWQLLYGKPL